MTVNLPTTLNGIEIDPTVHQQLAAAVQEPLLNEACLERVLLYMCKSEEFVGYLKQGPEIPEPHLGWWKDHTGGRSQWFTNELIPAIEKSGPISEQCILDFGTGTGSSAVSFAARGANVVGVENENVSIRVASTRAFSLGVQNRCLFIRVPFINRENGLKLPFHDSQFDIVTLVGVLEHMLTSEMSYCSHEIQRIVKPGGRVVIFDTPNRLHPFDHHTTRLWFAGWMPVALAHWWAVRRGRIQRGEDFARRGGTGVSRFSIDRLFPSSRWELLYEKPMEQIVSEFGWLKKGITFLNAKTADVVGMAAQKTAGLVLPLLQSVGISPALFPAMHTIIYRRL